MNLRRVVISALCTFSAVIAMARPAAAYPKLQIDIAGGTYNTTLSETVAGVNSDPLHPGLFTLYVYLNAPTSAELNTTYYIAAALTPKIYPPGGNFGSFNVGSTTAPFSFHEVNPSDPLYGTTVNVGAGQSTKVNATRDMVYGNPPFESYSGCSGSSANCSDSGDLASHGIYNTYYQEFAFKFNTPVRRANVYNVQTDNVSTPTNNANGTMYYEAFTIDTSFLSDYQVHFDLYSETIKSGGDIDINQFAPFSHTARSSSGFAPIPEPASMMLLGSGIATLAFRRFRRRRPTQS